MGQIKESISFIRRIEQAINNSTSSVALVNYPDKSHTYGQMALAIEGLTNILRTRGLQKGDKVAICAKNSIYWVEAYLAVVIGGYVAVVLPNNLQPKDVLLLLEHADCDAIFAESDTVEELSKKISIVFDIDFESLLFSSTDKVVPCGSLSLDEDNHVCFPDRDLDDVCTIMYTSGSMGAPKGSMITCRNLCYQMTLLSGWMCNYQRSRCQIVFLPFSHIFGLLNDVLAPICMEKELIIVGTNTSSRSILDAFQTYKPSILFIVPSLVDYIVRCVEGQYLSGDITSFDNQRVIAKAFGGNMDLIVAGGVSMSQELEQRFIHDLKIPLVTGYGSTESGPISVGIEGKYVEGSCGVIWDKEVVRIEQHKDSDISGEVQIKGDNVFAGYYKDINATKAAFTEDGWFKTGDLGYIDDVGNLFITGRCKDMLLTSNGENIYPEEVEAIVNASPYVKESILVQRGEKLYAIVVPDREKVEADGLTAEGLNKKVDEVVREASKKLPGFTIISGFELRDEPLERTPKGSLKRYLYSDGIKEN